MDPEAAKPSPWLRRTTSTGPAQIRTQVTLPLKFADGYTTTAVVSSFTGLDDGLEHLALALGDPASAPVALVRPHSECLTGEVFGSLRCDCGPQLREAVERIGEVGGYLLYMRQEGRGIGLYAKLDAYALQEQGLDTYEANRALDLPEDARDYTAAAQMLAALGAGPVDLLTNNPQKATQLRGLGVDVRSMVPTAAHLTPANARYLEAKVAHTHHTLDLALALAG